MAKVQIVRAGECAQGEQKHNHLVYYHQTLSNVSELAMAVATNVVCC